MKSILLAAAILLPVVATAQEAASNEILPFSRISGDPVSVAMGYTGRAAVSQVSFAAFRNAAAVPRFNGTADLSASFQRWGRDDSALAFGGAARTGSFGFTAGVLSLTGTPVDGFTPSDLSAGVGVGVALGTVVSAGVDVRYLSSRLASDETLSTMAFDAMLMASFSDVHVTVGVANVGSVSSGDTSYGIPASVAAAVDYARRFGDYGVRGDADLDYYLHSGAVTVGLGGELGYQDLVFVRAGYHLASKDVAALPSFLTAGVGVQYRGVRLDVAWLGANREIGSTVIAGLGYRF